MNGFMTCLVLAILIYIAIKVAQKDLEDIERDFIPKDEPNGWNIFKTRKRVKRRSKIRKISGR